MDNVQYKECFPGYRLAHRRGRIETHNLVSGLGEPFTQAGIERKTVDVWIRWSVTDEIEHRVFPTPGDPRVIGIGAPVVEFYAGVPGGPDVDIRLRNDATGCSVYSTSTWSVYQQLQSLAYLFPIFALLGALLSAAVSAQFYSIGVSWVAGLPLAACAGVSLQRNTRQVSILQKTISRYIAGVSLTPQLGQRTINGGFYAGQ